MLQSQNNGLQNCDTLEKKYSSYKATMMFRTSKLQHVRSIAAGPMSPISWWKDVEQEVSQEWTQRCHWGLRLLGPGL